MAVDSCTKQLWSIPWKCSMHAAELADDSQQTLQELRLKNAELASALCVSSIRLNAIEEQNRALETELRLLRAEMDEYCERERQEAQQDFLAASLWVKREKNPDESWDRPPEILFDARPLTVGKVVFEMRPDRSPQYVQRIGALVYEAYVRTHDRCPTPKIYYASDGTPAYFGCYTEDDRDLIVSVIRRHEKDQVPPKVDPDG